MSEPKPDDQNPHNQSPSPPHSAATPEKLEPSSPIKRSIPTRMFDSFRRDPNQKATETGEIIDLKLQRGRDESYDVESAIANTAKSPLVRKLEARHLQMIAIGGAIGTCLYSVTCIALECLIVK
jgi:amino acid transporter